MVALEIREGTLSGIMTFVMIWKGEAPILCAVSIILGFNSLRLLSTSLATKGNAAITRGTMEAVVPTVVPTISLVSGNTIIIRIRNGTERSRLMMTFSTPSSHLGRGSTPSFSPTTKSTPRGMPMIKANRVERTVT